MSLVSVFTRVAPTLGGIEFDAVLQDTLDASVELTGYTVESGATIADHRVVNPMSYQLVGGVSDNPIKASITDFTGALTGNAGGAGAAVAGLSAGFLAGSDETRSASALELLLELMRAGEPFDVDAGDIVLKDMVVTRIRRTKDANTDNALIFTAELSEWPSLKTAFSGVEPDISILPEGDPAQSQAASTVSRGELAGSVPGAAISSSVSGVLS